MSGLNKNKQTKNVRKTNAQKYTAKAVIQQNRKKMKIKKTQNRDKIVKVEEEPCLITPVNNLKLAQGITNTMVIETAINQQAFSFIPVGLVSMAMNRGYTTPYLFYLGIYDDILDIAQGGPGTATNRLRFMNDIYGALAPKTIPYRLTGNIGYKFTNFAAAQPGSFLSLDGGLFYYMWEGSGTSAGVWTTQEAPTYSITPATIADGYATAITLLSGKPKHIELMRNVNLSTKYEKDGSAYARSLNFYGQGSSDVGGPGATLELEVPFSSKFLGTLQGFDITQPRSSRFIVNNSGDSISNWSIGALPEFPTSYYNGAVTPVFKFLDLTEVVHAILNAYIEALQLFIQNTANLTVEDMDYLIAGLGCTYTQFFIFVRQQVMYMFNDSQALGQGISPATTPNGFRPFIVGSNTYGRLPLTIMLIAQVLNENLRCLKMAIRPYETKQYNNTSNHIIHIPIWGTFGGFEPLAYEITVNGIDYPLFLDESTDPNVPSIFDGTSGGNVVDFNTTPLIASIGVLWNEIQRYISNQYMGLTSMGGDARNGPFLQYTRYCAFVVPTYDVTNRKRIPKHWKKWIKEVVVEDETPVATITNTLTKKNSKTSLKKIKRIYAPSGSTILNEYTVAYSSLVPISPTMKENFGNIIIPVVEVSGGLPSVTQVQTNTLESYSLVLLGPSGISNSRSEEIIASCFNYVKGLAGDNSELSKYVSEVSLRNEGGFFGDIFAAIGPTLISSAASVLTGGVL